MMRTSARGMLAIVAAAIAVGLMAPSHAAAAAGVPARQGPPTTADVGGPGAGAPGSAVRATSYGFGAGTSFDTTDPREGTVLGADGVPTDIGKKNGHFVYYPVPSTTVTSPYDTGYEQTISMNKFGSGDAGDHVLAIDAAGAVWAWGGNRYGQLGLGTSGAAGGATVGYYPARVSTLPSTLTFVQVSAGSAHSMALTSTGDIYTWGGTNAGGVLGYGNATAFPTGQPTARKVDVPGVRFKHISAGNDYSLAVSTDGYVYAWGVNTSGSTTGVGGTGVPTRIASLSGINMVSAGYSHSGAVSSTGQLFMWGSQANGRLGNGVTSATVGGVQRVGSSIAWKAVHVGYGSTWGLTTGTLLYSWGANANGQLGLPDTVDRSTPSYAVGGIKHMSGNVYTVSVVLLNGDVLSAGSNVTSQLGGPVVNATWQPVTDGNATEVVVGRIGAAYRGAVVNSWGSGMQTGRGTTQTFGTPGPVGAVAGKPAVPWVLETTTTPLPDAQAASSSIVFGAPGQVGTVTGDTAKNIAVVSNNGVKYLRGDVPPHPAGVADVYLKWNDGKNSWQDTGSYRYTLALKLDASPKPARAADEVTVTASLADPQEAKYVGSAAVDFSIPALGGGSPSLVASPGSAVNAVPFVNAAAVTRLGLRAGQQPNNGPYGWLFDASATARVAGVEVQRAAAVGTIEFEEVPAEKDVRLWAMGLSGGGETGLTGSSWRVHPDSATAPGSPDTASTVTAFTQEVTNDSASVPSQKKGWFTAALKPGTYWLVETTAPGGRQLLPRPLQFTVAASGAVSLGSGASTLTRVTNGWDSGPTLNTIVVRSVDGIALPAAGSAPWAWIPFTGLSLLGAAAVLALRRRRVPRTSSES